MLLLGYVLLALVVAALLFYGIVALLPGGLALTPQRDNRPFELPADRRMDRRDLERVRIPVGVRGYRFAETDDLIDRLAAEIVVRDEEIARLRSQAAGAAHQPAVEASRSATGPGRSVAEASRSVAEPRPDFRDGEPHAAEPSPESRPGESWYEPRPAEADGSKSSE